MAKTVFVDIDATTEVLLNTVYAVNDRVTRNGSPLTDGVTFECTVAGDTGGTYPTWDLVVGNPTVFGAATFVARDADSFTSALPTLNHGTGAFKSGVDDNQHNLIIVASSHAENYSLGGDYNIAANFGIWEVPLVIIVVSKTTGEYDPANLLGTGTPHIVCSTGSIRLQAMIHVYGLFLESSESILANNTRTFFRDCVLSIGATDTTAAYLDFTSSENVRLKNCRVITKVAVDCQLQLRNSTQLTFEHVVFQMNVSGLGFISNTSSTTSMNLKFDNCVLDLTGSSILLDTSENPYTSLHHQVLLSNCELPASIELTDGTIWVYNFDIEVVSSSFGGTSLLDFRKESIKGKVRTLFTTYLNSGFVAESGATRLSQQILPDYPVFTGNPIESFYISGTLQAVGAKTLKLEFLENFTVALTLADLSVELEYLNSATSAWMLLDDSAFELYATTPTALDAGIGVPSWTNPPSNSRSVSISIPATFLRPGYYRAKVYLSKFEAGKEVVIDPMFHIT